MELDKVSKLVDAINSVADAFYILGYRSAEDDYGYGEDLDLVSDIKYVSEQYANLISQLGIGELVEIHENCGVRIKNNIDE